VRPDNSFKSKRIEAIEKKEEIERLDRERRIK